MGFLNGLFRSRDKPQNRTAGSGYSFFLGGTTAGKAVTERSAMQMTAVYIPKEVLDAFARYIIPEIRRFHESEERQAFYKEWLEKHPEYAEK